MTPHASPLQVIIFTAAAFFTVGIAVITFIANILSGDINDLDTRPQHLRSKFPK